MSERSYVYDGILVGDATIAPYSSADWAELQRYLVGAAHNDYGVLAGTGNGTQLPLEVQSTAIASASINMFAGAAIINGRVYINDATLNLAIGANASGNTRIDTLIIRRDTVAQIARASIKQGTPAVTPVPATLQQDATTWEIPVAYITVANGFSVINQVDIANCGQIVGGNAQQYIDDVLNNSGGRLEVGDVVIWDITTTRAVTTTTTQNDLLVAGTWVSSTPNGGRGRVQIRGFGWVRVDPGIVTVPIGAGLITQASAKRSQPANIGFFKTAYGIGRTMETFASAAGIQIRLAFIDVKPHAALYGHCEETVGGGTTPGGINSGSWSTRWPVSGGGSIALPGIVTNIGSNRLEIAQGVPFEIHYRVPGYKVDKFSARLFDITASGGYDGTVETAMAAANMQAWSEGRQSFGGVFPAQENFRIEQQVTTTNGTDGKGVAPAAWQTGTAVPYTQIEVWRGWS